MSPPHVAGDNPGLVTSGSISAESPALIIGAGIGGLTAALALLRRGIAVEVHEQAGMVGDVGAGISLGPTAAHGLYALGLEASLRTAADRPGPSAALHYQTGERLGGAFANRDYTGADFEHTHMIHRADLFALLRAAVETLDPGALRFGRRFSGFAQGSDGVTAHFADGSVRHGVILLGCDGVRSAVRAQMFGAGAALKTGQVAYRFLVPLELAAPHLGIGRSNIFIAPRRSLLYYPIRKGTVLNCVALVCSDAWTAEGWSQRVAPEELQSLFTGWHPTATALAAHAPADNTAKWALFDRDPLDVWVQGRVALLGDAAHPMLPFLGLGAAMGIEDAVILGRAFGQADGEDALRLYQAARVGRAAEMLREARRQSEIFADGPDSPRRLKTTLQERMDYNPASVAL
jgi:salicylate hydroxylase